MLTVLVKSNVKLHVFNFLNNNNLYATLDSPSPSHHNDLPYPLFHKVRYAINVRSLRPVFLIVLSPIKMVAVCMNLPLQKPRRKLYHENGKSGLLLQTAHKVIGKT